MFKIIEKISGIVKKYQADIILVIGVFLIALFCFAAGYITAKKEAKPMIQFEQSISK